MNEDLSEIYLDPSHPASFSSPYNLYQYAKHMGYSKKQVNNWLQQQDVYTLHKQVKHKIPRPRVIVSAKDQEWDGDTVNMEAYRSKNKGYAYILILIDIFTRFAWTVPLKTLTGKEMVHAMKEVFTSYKPEKLRTDSGSEFKNKYVKVYLTQIGIKHFTTTNVVKANFAKRLIKTLKSKIICYMKHNQTKHWIDVLTKITNSYNKSKHRSIKMSPQQARESYAITLWNYQYGPKNPQIHNQPPKPKPVYKFEENDRVRLAKYKTTFERYYDEKWTHEIFTVTDRKTQ